MGIFKDLFFGSSPPEGLEDYLELPIMGGKSKKSGELANDAAKSYRDVGRKAVVKKDTYGYSVWHEKDPDPWIVGLSLGQDAGLGGLMDALPALRDGIEGKVSGFFQQLHIKIGAVLLGPNRVAGVSSSFKTGALAQRIPEQGIFSDKVERVLQTKTAVRLSAIHREGQIQGIRQFVVKNKVGSILEVIASSGLEPENQLLATIGVIEAIGESMTKESSDYQSLKNFINTVTAQFVDRDTIGVAVNATRLDAIQDLINDQLGVDIKLRPIETPNPQGAITSLLTQRYINSVARTINKRLELAKNDQSPS